MLREQFSIVAALFSMFMYGQSEAAITLSSTRVVFDGSKKEASVTVRNLGSDELLVQSWLESNNKSVSAIPFAVTPPLAHMAGKSRQVLRVLFQGAGVPTDKESVFWLNVQEIPKASSEENVLQLAIRQRIKLFYRPAGLPQKVQDAPATATWQVIGQGATSIVRIENPSLYHLSFTELQVKGTSYTSSPVNSFMVAPGSSSDIPVGGITKAEGLTLSVKSINDYGGKDLYSAPLKSSPTQLKQLKDSQ